MECKCLRRAELQDLRYELIDTLWNVNICADNASKKSNGELIDTLWNVNNDTIKVPTGIRCRINRYIMECK